MNQRNILIGVCIAALLFLNSFGRPYLRRRNALKTVQTVLNHWKDGNLTQAMSFWEHEKDSPPVYNLSGYRIVKQIFKKEDNVYTALITTVLYFPSNNQFPSGEKWLFKLAKTRHGWRITDFRLVQN